MTPRALIVPARLAGAALLRSQSDSRLVDLVRAGNDRAFEAIVQRYERSLLRHCRKLLPRGRAEDAVQQAFLHALEAMRADRRELRLEAWLHRIAHNAAIDSLRRMDSHWEELDERMDGVEPTHAAAERRARFRSVVANMDSLPERQRRALVLRELEGRTYEEIAADLGATGAGVRQLLNRARNAMRAGACALMPSAVVGRLVGSQAGVRVAELADPPGTSSLVGKAAAAVAAGTLAMLAATTPDDRPRSPHAHAGVKPPALDRRGDGAERPQSPLATAAPELAARRPASLATPRYADGDPDAGGGPAGETLLERDTAAPAPRRGRGPFGTGHAHDGADAHRGGGPAAGSPDEGVPVASSSVEEEDRGDDAPEGDEQAAGDPPPEQHDADDDAPVPTGVGVGASPADLDEDAGVAAD